MKTIAFAAVLSATIATSPAYAACTLSDEAEAAVRAAAAEYVTAWLSNEEAQVMNLLHDDIVLTPPMGAEPKVGVEAARDFWFPKDSPPFIITAFQQEVSDIEGCKDVAVVRGRQKQLEWTYDGEKFRNKGSNYISVYKKRDGEWRLLWQTWNTAGTDKITEGEE